jgi:putative chitinase
MNLTAEQLGDVMPFAGGGRVARFLEPLNVAMTDADITTPLRLAMFLAQIAHESGELRYTEEIASGSAYEYRRDLGNTHPGDGRKYKGRGLIQVTGRANYAACSRWMSGNENLFLDHPEMLADDPLFAAKSVAWFWITRALNPLSDRADVALVSRRINGGSNGMLDRIRYYDRARVVLGVGQGRPR